MSGDWNQANEDYQERLEENRVQRELRDDEWVARDLERVARLIDRPSPDVAGSDPIDALFAFGVALARGGRR
jgi:hypothetical protein